ncbi:MAG: AAA family ATPase [Desulfuromonas thiophila]|jgi:chromosome partitioning protein|nr:AAA family ATPase [Desulfuromonas thiophila]
MIYAIGNVKGGVGKSMLSVQIALWLALDGREVWLVDGDKQLTSQMAMSVRAEDGHSPLVACSSYPDGKDLRTQVKQQCSKYDDVVIDVGGRDSPPLRAALMLADVLIVPFQPRSIELWALKGIVDLIDEANSMRDGLKAYALLNMADPGDRSTDNVEAAEAIVDFPQLEYLPTPIRRRKAFATAIGLGQSVREFKPQDKKAIDEISEMLTALQNKLS